MLRVILVLSFICLADEIFCSRIDISISKNTENFSDPSLQSGKLIVANSNKDFQRNRRDYGGSLVPLASEVLEGGVYSQHERPHKPHGHRTKKRKYGQQESGITQGVESYANGYGETNGGGGYAIGNGEGVKNEGGYGNPMKGYGDEEGGYGGMDGGYLDPVPEYGGGDGYGDPMGGHGGKGGGGKGAGHGIGEAGEEFGTGTGYGIEERVPNLKGDGYGPNTAGNGKYTAPIKIGGYPN